MDLYLYLLYCRVNIHDHSEYLITSHEVECWFTVWRTPPPPVPASHCIQLPLKIDSGLSWRRPYQITLQTNLTPLLLWASVSVCVDLFMLPWSIFSYYEPVALLHIQFLLKNKKKPKKTIQIKRIKGGMKIHLMFCYCIINCCYLFMWKLSKKSLSPGVRFAVVVWVLI